jgi:hypothetical protein
VKGKYECGKEPTKIEGPSPITFLQQVKLVDFFDLRPWVKHATRNLLVARRCHCCCSSSLPARFKPSLLCAEVRFAAYRQQFSSTFSLRSASYIWRAIPILVSFINLVFYSTQNISCLSQQSARHASIVSCTLPQLCLISIHVRVFKCVNLLRFSYGSPE